MTAAIDTPRFTANDLYRERGAEDKMRSSRGVLGALDIPWWPTIMCPEPWRARGRGRPVST